MILSTPSKFNRSVISEDTLTALNIGQLKTNIT